MKQASLIILFVALLITACSPRYQIAREYVPPTSSAGMQCVSGCSARNQSCVQGCNQGQAQCERDARFVAQDNLAAAMDAYNEEMRDYSANIEIYYVQRESWDRERQRISAEMDSARLKCERDQHANRAWCDIWGQRKSEYRRLHEPAKPVKPVRPSLESETTRLQAACKDDCGCAGLYDKCYQGCGGQVVHRKICVSGCD